MDHQPSPIDASIDQSPDDPPPPLMAAELAGAPESDVPAAPDTDNPPPLAAAAAAQGVKEFHASDPFAASASPNITVGADASGVGGESGEEELVLAAGEEVGALRAGGDEKTSAFEPASTGIDGVETGAFDIGVAAPGMDNLLPLGSDSVPLSAVAAQEVEVAPVPNIVVGEESGGDILDACMPRPVEQEELLSFAGEEVSAPPQCGLVGEAGAVDEEKAPVFESGTTIASTCLVDETSKSEEAGIPQCEELLGSPSVLEPAATSDSFVVAEGDAANLDAKQMEADGSGISQREEEGQDMVDMPGFPSAAPSALVRATTDDSPVAAGGNAAAVDADQMDAEEFIFMRRKEEFQDVDDGLLLGNPSVAPSVLEPTAASSSTVAAIGDAAAPDADKMDAEEFGILQREYGAQDIVDVLLLGSPLSAPSVPEPAADSSPPVAVFGDAAALEVDQMEAEESGSPQSEERAQDVDDALFPSALEPAASDAASLDADQMDEEESEEPMAESARRGRGRVQKKRGRSTNAQVPKTPAKKRKEKEDEEVCFICFDGGDLVVCDRRGCPKVYHPSCVNRDEAFFRAKGRWNCGWHICSKCQKSAQYMCYTCTFSLCKVCINEAELVRVRENKGLCATCMSIVIMIESRDDGSNKACEIDFDDKSSWMFLFKDYWLDLKGKFSLTLEELTRAKTPRKDVNAISRAESSEDVDTANNVEGASSGSSSRRFKVGVSSKKKGKKRARKIAEESSVKEAESEVVSVSEDVGWASKELLEFVAHMKDGDKSALSQFDVQALLLDYIKLNNLRDPRARSQIICDIRLQNLFGKTRVGHFEMLKLLESHFFTKVPSPVVTDENQGGVLDPDPSQMDTEGNSDASTRMSSDKRRRTHKRLKEKEPQTNLDDYAAINGHNISLMYLRRNLMEDLVDDTETFSEKVVGTFVRIRIPGSGQRQDIYRLVQVVGTGKAAKKYRTGKKNTDFTLEISNLNKTEFITIDIISNQEFTEEECKRLRQSIKCGFIGRLTVGEVQEKARVLRALRVNDWLESEKLRLGNLRDRASEKGRRKELRECIEMLQLLSTPEERLRRLKEDPEIHADPKMDPDYESSEDEELDDKKQDNFDHSKDSFLLRRGNVGMSSGKDGSISCNNWSSTRKSANTGWEPKRNTPVESSCDIGSSASGGNITTEPSFNQEKQVVLYTCTNAGGLEGRVSSDNQLVIKSGQSSVGLPETTATSSLNRAAVPSNTSETEKMWHYQDPAGKVQGPFSITQLRKWNSTGYFPASLGIWRTSERQEDSILLTDALLGKFQKDLPQLQPQYNRTAQPAKVPTRMDAKGNECGGGWRGSSGNTWTDNNRNAENWKASHNDAGRSAISTKESMRTDMWTAQSSAGSTTKQESVNPKGGRVGLSSGDWHPSNDNNAWSGQSQGLNSSRPVSSFSGSTHRSSSYHGRGGRGRWNGGQDRQNNQDRQSRWDRGMQPGNQGYERHPNWNNSRGYERHPNWNNSLQHSSGGHMNSPPVNNTSNQLRHDSFNMAIVQSGWTNTPGSINNFPSTVPVPLPVPVQVVNSAWASTTTPRGNEDILRNPIQGACITDQPMNSGWVGGSSSSLNVSTQAVTEDGGSLCPVVSASVPNTAKISETANSVKIPEQNVSLGYSQMPGEQQKRDTSSISEGIHLPCPDGTIKQNDEMASSFVSKEFRGILDENQSLESACPGANTRYDQEANDVRASSQLNDRKNHEFDANNNKLEANDSSVAENRVTSVDSGVLAPATCTRESSSKLETASSDPNQLLTVDSESMVAADTLLPISSHGLVLSSDQKQKLDDSRVNPACTGNTQEQARSPKSEPILLGPIPVESVNLDVVTEKNSLQPIPPLTTSSNPSPWYASGDPTIGNRQNSSSTLPISSQPSTSFHGNVATTFEAARPSNSGLGITPQNPTVATILQIPTTATALQNPNTATIPQIPTMATVPQNPNPATMPQIPTMATVPQNPNPATILQNPMTATIPTQANSSMIWGAATQGNTNAGWGAVTQGNMNVVWGVPAQGNANMNIGWGTPVQANPSASSGWGAPAQGEIIVNSGWGTPTQGYVNQNTSWAAPQGNTSLNPGWGAAAQGNPAPNPSVGPIQGNMNPNLSSEIPSQGIANANAGGPAGQGNKNPTWNHGSLSTQHNQTGDRHSIQRERDFNSRNMGGGRRWNKF